MHVVLWLFMLSPLFSKFQLFLQWMLMIHYFSSHFTHFKLLFMQPYWLEGHKLFSIHHIANKNINTVMMLLSSSKSILFVYLWFFLLNILQMPIREACHVAVQINHPSKHRLWKHAQARQNVKGKGSTPVLQIVCTSH